MSTEWLQNLLKKKRLLIGISIAVVVIILVMIPVSYIRTMHNSKYDIGFEYVKVDNLVNEIARKHTYYEASDKTIQIQLYQDLINSLIKDNLSSLDLALPKKVSIEEVAFNTKDQRLYINAKYGNINVPISAKVNLDITDTGITVSADDLMLGQKRAPGFVKKQIPSDQLTYSIKYEDLAIPSYVALKDIQFGTGNLKVIIQLNADEITKTALTYRKDMIGKLDEFKKDQSVVVSTFIDKLLGTGVLSEDKTKEYVGEILNSEDIVNSAIYLATGNDINKYAGKLKETSKKVATWAAPLQTITYTGDIDDTVNTILHDQELTELYTWFLPEKAVNDYIATADTYYGLTKEYASTFEKSSDINETLATVNNILHDEKLNEVYTMFLPQDTLNEYITTVDSYYGIYNAAQKYLSSFQRSNDLSSTVNTVKTVLKDEQLNQLYTMFIPKETINQYIATVDSYSNIYNTAQSYLNKLQNSSDIFDKVDAVRGMLEDNRFNQFITMFVPKENINQLTGTIDNFYEIVGNVESSIAKIDTAPLREYTELASNYVNQTKGTKEYLADQVDLIDTDLIQDFVIDTEIDLMQNNSLPGKNYRQIDSRYIEDFNAYVMGLDKTQDYVQDYLEDMDLSGLDRCIDEINAWENFITDIVTLLQQKEYTEVFDTFAKSNTSDNSRKAFVKKYLIEKDFTILKEINNTQKQIQNQLTSQ